MDIQPIFNKAKKPIIIAGPCSAETEKQVLVTAHALAKQNIDLFRAGIWKPRTRPGSFEGVGAEGLPWLKKVKEETGLKVTTEVAKTKHVEKALKYGVDVLWLGARTTVNPFSVQEVADALQGVHIPILIKNPINPDLKLWVGAIERIYKAGIRKIAIIHRGFSHYGAAEYRNIPRWQIPIELKRLFPALEIICDNSHICGRRDTLQSVAQKALDLQFDGIMTEVHPTPDDAWSDAKQQITPAVFEQLTQELIVRNPNTNNPEYNNSLHHFRNEINELDAELLRLLSNRMKIAEQIGIYKKTNNVSVFQPTRWSEIMETVSQRAKTYNLSDDFIAKLLQVIHQESINRQVKVMNEKKKNAEQ